MKTKFILICIWTLMMSSCTTYHQLPTYRNIDVYEYGSFISIKNNEGKYYAGELIAVDNNKIIILRNFNYKDTKECMTIPISDVNYFRLRYAQPKNYAWAIPLFVAATISHGAVLIFTLPLNLIVSASVAGGGNMAFSYGKKNVTYDELRKFARFPQGIPPNIELSSIK